MINTKSSKLVFIFLLLIPIYVLFGLGRFKEVWSYYVDGMAINNVLYLALLTFVIAVIRINVREKSELWIASIFCILFLQSIVMLFLSENIGQSLYGVLSLFLPISFLFIVKLVKNNIISLLKILCFLVFVYSGFVIIVSLNFNLIMDILGNSHSTNYGWNYAYQYRVKMPFGSSITTSYLFNLFIPIDFYFFSKSKCKKTKLVYLAYIVFESVSCLSQLSRLSAVVLLFEILLCALFLIKNKKSKVFLFLIFFAIAILSINFFDLSRLTNGLFDGDSSNSRIEAMRFGLNIHN